MPPMWRQSCPQIPSLPNPRAAILNFVKGVWGRGNVTLNTAIYSSDMKIKLLPALQDNYMYMIIDEKTKHAAIVDPVEPEKVINAMKEENIKLTHVLTTHHHWDHAGGNEELVKQLTDLVVCGGDERIGALNKKVKDGDKIKVGSLNVTCIFTPCHTSGHMCYYVEGDSNVPAIFTGDCLFVGGCGRFFEGTAQQMHEALNEKLSKFPDVTNVYCGHEYTVKNLMFALHVEPNNRDAQQKLEWAKNRRDRNLPTIPSTLGEEKLFNPFMRTNQPVIQQHVHASNIIEVMAALRKDKDSWKPK
ncbi:hydroxyacylglutathione hydrolase, mitochondrial isoform X2 [Hydra vulgaris]|uniref:hydroxyacylglutathione hydrolase n=1 Tax=Hydra vulgaris TaxID=6087 RepID=A0ABM4CC45_HYDVU